MEICLCEGAWMSFPCPEASCRPFRGSPRRPKEPGRLAMTHAYYLVKQSCENRELDIIFDAHLDENGRIVIEDV
jgi:hypothetical protein